MKTRQQIKSNLKPFNHVIQICGCGKVDAYKDDGHSCEQYLQREYERNNYWK